MNWLGSGTSTVSACAARVETGITSVQELIGPNARQLVVAAIGPGTTTFDTPSVLNAALGTNFKIVSGYDGSSKMLLAVEAKEADGVCGNFDLYTGPGRHLVEGTEPTMRLLIAMGAEPMDYPLAARRAGGRAAGDDRGSAADAPGGELASRSPTIPTPSPRASPPDRVAALRKALLATFDDPQFRADAPPRQAST